MMMNETSRARIVGAPAVIFPLGTRLMSSANFLIMQFGALIIESPTSSNLCFQCILQTTSRDVCLYIISVLAAEESNVMKETFITNYQSHEMCYPNYWTSPIFALVDEIVHLVPYSLLILTGRKASKVVVAEVQYRWQV